MPPLYVVGAGAIGLHLAARLSAVAPVTIVARSQRVAALERDGFDLSGLEEAHYNLPVRDLRAPFPADADILLAVKPTQLAGTLPDLRVRPGQTLILCQNGLGVAALTRAARPHAPLVRLAGWLGTTLAATLNVRVASPFQLELAADDPGLTPTCDRLQALLTAARYDVRRGDGVLGCEWRTALWHLAVAGLCAVLSERNGAVLDSPPLGAVARALLDEVRAVAAGDGVDLDDADLERVFAATAVARDVRGPLLQDLVRGVATEMPFLNAEVARRAGARGQTALVNAVVARLVEHCERRAREAAEAKPATGPASGPPRA